MFLDDPPIVSLADAIEFFVRENVQILPRKQVLIFLDGGAFVNSRNVGHDSFRTTEEVEWSTRTRIAIAVWTAKLDCAAISQDGDMRKDFQKWLRVGGAHLQCSISLS